MSICADISRCRRKCSNPDRRKPSAIGGSDRGVKAIKDNHRPALAANEMKPATVIDKDHNRPLNAHNRAQGHLSIGR